MIVKPQRPVIDRVNPLAQGLVAAYALNNVVNAGKNLVTSRSGTGVTGAGVGVSTGPAGRGLSFLGGGTIGQVHLDVPADLGGARPWSVYSLNKGIPNSDKVIGMGYTGVGDSRICQLGLSSAGLIYVMRAPGSYDMAAYTDSVTDSVRAMVGTYDGSTLRLYLNGVFRSSVSSTGTMTVPTPSYRLGDFVSGLYRFQGLIFDWRVWDRALRPQEIANMYTDPWALYRTTNGLNGLTSAEEFASPITSRAFYYRNFVASRGF